VILVTANRREQTLIGIDVGGTKCAAGLVRFPSGEVWAKRLCPTLPQRGGAAVLADVVELATTLERDAEAAGTPAAAIGLGVAELVGANGRIVSDATIRWNGLAVDEVLRDQTGLPVRIEADVRAAARAEAQWGAGRGFNSFLYITVGTGISGCLVTGGVPYTGAHGLTGTFASSGGLIPGAKGELCSGPPLERFSSGPALAERYAAGHAAFSGTASDVISLAESGDVNAVAIVTTAGRALGAAIASLVNMLDPEAVVIGGGLGMVVGKYRESLESAMREHIWSDLHRDLPLRSAELGSDAGFIGAALAAARI
jgi:predicted NBD/HSP70 family sugar kinase